MRSGKYQKTEAPVASPKGDDSKVTALDAIGGPPNEENAEKLFETRTIAEIREVEKRTRQEAEDKNEELRRGN